MCEFLISDTKQRYEKEKNLGNFSATFSKKIATFWQLLDTFIGNLFGIHWQLVAKPIAMAYIVIVVFSPKFWSINLISLLYISQGKPEFQTFVAIWREQGNDNEGRANQADLRFSIRWNREREIRETC